jgi:hypothetical protein
MNWDDKDIFCVEMTVREFHMLQRAQYRDGETLEDTLMRLAGLREKPWRGLRSARIDGSRAMAEAAHRLSLEDARKERS